MSVTGFNKKRRELEKELEEKKNKEIKKSTKKVGDK